MKRELKLGAMVTATLLLWVMLIVFSVETVTPTGMNALGNMTLTELEDALDETDSYIRQRYAERLYDSNSDGFHAGYYFLDLANHYGSLDTTGTVTATAFYGDGTGITGITSTPDINGE